jgi:hypothetical protein
LLKVAIKLKVRALRFKEIKYARVSGFVLNMTKQEDDIPLSEAVMREQVYP